MNIYDIRRFGTVLFFMVSIAVVVVFVLVSNSLVADLSAQERERMQIWADATKQIADIGQNPDAPDVSPENLEFLFGIIEQNHTIPVLLTDDEGNTIEFNPVEGDPYNQTTSIKRSDGSVLYDVAFRNQTEDQIRTLAAEACMSFNSVHMEGFDELSQTQIQAFDSFIRYAQSQGTTVILVLSPWHPYLYGYLLTEPENHKGFFQVENWLRQYCADNNVPIYGSYDPACIEGLQETDFFDGLHCGGTGIARFFPGIPQALSDLQNGTLANPLDVHPRTSLEDPNAQPAEGEAPDGEVTQQEG